MNFKRKPRRQLDVNIVPLLDVMTILLIFFMVTTTFANMSGIKIDLPDAKTAEVKPEEQQVTVTIDDQGRYFVQDEEVTAAELGKRLLYALKGDPDRVVVIQADRNISHEKVVVALDVARQLGLSRLAIATTIKQDNQP